MYGCVIWIVNGKYPCWEECSRSGSLIRGFRVVLPQRSHCVKEHATTNCSAYLTKFAVVNCTSLSWHERRRTDKLQLGAAGWLHGYSLPQPLIRRRRNVLLLLLCITPPSLTLPTQSLSWKLASRMQWHHAWGIIAIEPFLSTNACHRPNSRLLKIGLVRSKSILRDHLVEIPFPGKIIFFTLNMAA